jgi:hypothetical protein
MVGYHQRETGVRHYAPLEFITNVSTIVESLPNYRCSCDHDHVHIYGEDARDKAEWPDELDKLVLDWIVEEAKNIAEENAIAFPSVSIAPKRKERPEDHPGPKTRSSRRRHKSSPAAA